MVKDSLSLETPEMVGSVILNNTDINRGVHGALSPQMNPVSYVVAADLLPKFVFLSFVHRFVILYIF